MSTPVTVTAGMFVKLIKALLFATPADAAEKAIVARAYEPPEISVPAVVFVPVVDASASFIGPVGAVYAVVDSDASSSRFASAWTMLFATGDQPFVSSSAAVQPARSAARPVVC